MRTFCSCFNARKNSRTLRERSFSSGTGRAVFTLSWPCLGYVDFGSGASVRTITHEQRLGAGSADQALGYYSDTRNEVIAPMELKSAKTLNLDAIMPGRHKSPVQQVWEYAMDTPGCKFLIVSNMLEIRLYAVGHTRKV